MRIKKYLLFLLVIIIASINTVYADECYYTGSGLFITYNTGKTKEVTIKKIGMKIISDTEAIQNWYSGAGCNAYVGTGAEKECVTPYNGNKNTCPPYVVVDDNKSGINSYEAYAFDNATEAQKWVTKINGFSKHTARMTTYRPGMTKEEFEKMLVQDLGNIDNPLDPGGTDAKVDCSIFGSKNDKDSIAYLVNEIMNYFRIIVPTLIILYGTIDFFKAVVSKNAEEKKKHQTKFIKRLIAGMIVFLAPFLVNIIMGLADMIWSYGTPCSMQYK